MTEFTQREFQRWVGEAQELVQQMFMQGMSAYYGNRGNRGAAQQVPPPPMQQGAVTDGPQGTPVTEPTTEIR